MRRSAALAPLSRDHHHALVIAQALIRAGPGDAAAAAGRFLSFLEHHELAHFALEESVLLPAIQDHARGPAFARRVRDDHEFLRTARERMAANPAQPDPGLLHEVGSRLRAHVQMEERELFPYVESSLNPGRLEAVGRQIAAHDADDDITV